MDEWCASFWEQWRNRNRDLRKTYGVRVVTAVEDEPITLEEAWAHLRLDTDGSPLSSDDDEWLTGIGIPGARDWCEHFLGRSIGQQTLELSTKGFPSGVIPLSFGPVLSIVSVTYTDAEGVPDTVMDPADYELDAFASPPAVRLVYGASWPSALSYANSVTVQYLAGYNLTGDSPMINPLPAGIRSALLLTLGHLFANRETTIAGPSVGIQEIPIGAAALLERYRLRLSMA